MNFRAKFETIFGTEGTYLQDSLGLLKIETLKADFLCRLDDDRQIHDRSRSRAQIPMINVTFLLEMKEVDQ